jgi:catechol 2,3-dioxygenase-like lactoylglutathione lyase family enzyme
MIDHFTLPVSDIDRSKSFYMGALAPLGLTLKADHALDPDGGACGFGSEAEMAGVPGEHGVRFWIVEAERRSAAASPAGQHVAFRAPSRLAVDAFHAIAVASGGKDNGAPGLRPQYHESYYAAFVLDPDGRRLEAVCHR